VEQDGDLVDDASAPAWQGRGSGESGQPATEAFPPRSATVRPATPVVTALSPGERPG